MITWKKQNKVKWLFFSLLLGILINHKGLMAQEEKRDALLLKDVISLALKNNLQLSAARKGLDIARGQLTQASILSPFNPVLEGEVGNRNTEGENETDREISLSQTIEIFGQRGKRIAVAKLNLDRVEAEVKDLERLITVEVKDSFYTVLYQQNILQFRGLVKDITQRLFKAVSESYEAGTATILELNLAKIEFARAKKELLDAQRDYRTVLLELKRLMAIPPEKALDIKGDFSYRPIKSSLAALLDHALRIRPDLIASRHETERARADTTLLKAERLPNLGVSAFSTREEGTDDIIGGRISIEIPLFNRLQGVIEQAKATEARSSIDLENTRLTIKKEVEDAYQAFTSLKEGVEIFEKEVIGQIRENLGLNEFSYREGQIDLTDYLVAQNSLLTTQISYLDSLLGYYEILIQLEKVSAMSLVR